MQFKRGGWQYSEADGVVTMPGNARQAFPAKRDAATAADRGGLGKGARNGDNHTIRAGRSGSLLRICLYAILYSLHSRYYAIAIYPARRDATRRGSHRPDASLYLIPRKLPEYLHENAANNREYLYLMALSAILLG